MARLVLKCFLQPCYPTEHIMKTTVTFLSFGFHKNISSLSRDTNKISQYGH